MFLFLILLHHCGFIIFPLGICSDTFDWSNHAPTFGSYFMWWIFWLLLSTYAILSLWTWNTILNCLWIVWAWIIIQENSKCRVENIISKLWRVRIKSEPKLMWKLIIRNTFTQWVGNVLLYPLFAFNVKVWSCWYVNTCQR